MACNRETEYFAPLPRGPRQTREAIAIRALLMWLMMDRLDFDMSRLKRDEIKSKFAAMTNRCFTCANTHACEQWLDSVGQPDAYREFCPNASTLAESSNNG